MAKEDKTKRRLNVVAGGGSVHATAVAFRRHRHSRILVKRRALLTVVWALCFSAAKPAGQTEEQERILNAPVLRVRSF